MKTIQLSKGEQAIVDDWNYEWLKQYNWFVVDKRNKTDKCARHYACRNIYIGNRQVRKQYMHRDILGLQFGDRIIGDHKNHNTLDNRESNLRIATSRQNVGNAKKPIDGKQSKYKGVCWHERLEKWRAYIAGKHLGVFDDELGAAAAYDLAALKYFGEFANTNFEIAMNKVA